MLNIRFIGKVNIEYDGMEISHKFSGKALALLSFLLLENKPVSRDKLTACLWPDSTEEAGKYNLRFNLWQIKNIVGSDFDGNELITIDRGFCSINKSYDFKCDIIAVKEAEVGEHITEEQLNDVCKNFRGEFMEGFYFKDCNDFNEIILYERNRMEDLKVKLLLDLVEMHRVKGDINKCLDILLDLMKIQPYDEEIAAKVMNFYEMQGKYSHSIMFYNEFKKRLMSHLGIKPSEVLNEKYEALQSGTVEISQSNERIASVEKNTSFAGISEASKVIHMKATSMENVDFFCISDILKNLSKYHCQKVKGVLNRGQIYDLASIQPLVLSSCGFEDKGDVYNVPTVRVASAFVFMIEELLERGYVIELTLVNGSKLDKSSRDLLDYCSNLDGFNIINI